MVVMLVLKNTLFTVVVPGTVAVYLPLYLARVEHATRQPALLGISAFLFTLGITGYLWCVLSFAIIGKGTPAPIDAPKRLIVVGPHRYVRNPMYLAVLSVIAAWAVIFTAPQLLAYLGVVAAVFHLVVVLFEEPLLRRKFGPEYASYCESVPRWLPHHRGARA
jgi:protein-S-isoprenylcysteine O-methyltransferase Ste14